MDPKLLRQSLDGLRYTQREEPNPLALGLAQRFAEILESRFVYWMSRGISGRDMELFAGTSSDGLPFSVVFRIDTQCWLSDVGVRLVEHRGRQGLLVHGANAPGWNHMPLMHWLMSRETMLELGVMVGEPEIDERFKDYSL